MTSASHASEWASSLLRHGGEAMWDRLSWYPPFLFFGIDIRFSKEAHRIDVRIPLRWYFRNNSGVMFGAAMVVATDPFPALMLQRLIPKSMAWTRRHQIEYLRPATGTVSFSLELSEADVRDVERELSTKGRAQRNYCYSVVDENDRRVAKIDTVAYLARARG